MRTITLLSGATGRYGYTMTGPLVAGVDCSTQATKVLIVDTAEGAVVAQGRSPHTVTGTGGARETHPDVWWHALQEALARTGRASEVGAISVGGQQHGLVVCDAASRPLRPAPLWNDTRSAPDAAALTAELGGPAAWAALVGSVPVASFTVTTWAWLRRTEPEVARLAAAVHLPHDHLIARLTGQAATDRGDASGTGWWSPRTERYVAEVLDAVGLDVGLLPGVLGPAQPAGEVMSTAAAALGLGPHVLVGPGTGDNAAAALGLGLSTGQAALSLGTSGTIYAVSERPAADPLGTVAGFADATGRFLPLAATLNATLAVDRVAGWLALDREAVEAGGEAVVLPFFDGERTPNLPAAAATITGLRHDTTPGQILRAAYEGVAVSLLDALDHVAEQAGGLDPAAPLVLIGGGARGRVYQDTVSRLSGRAVLVPDSQELVALGAAVQAAAVLTGKAPQDVARRWNLSAGPHLEAVAQDVATLERHRAARSALATLNRAG